jgi:hypothetical protein
MKSALHTAITVSLATAVALSGTACSFAFTRRPPSQHQQMASFDCTESRVAPVLDVLFTSFQALRTAAALSASDADYEGAALSRPADIGFGLALGALGLASATYGFNAAGECRQARNQARMRSYQQERMSWMPPPGAAPAEAEFDR